MPKHDHTDDHDCDCGCEHEFETVTLVDDDGNEHNFTVIDILEVDGRSYAVLAPEGEEDDDEDEGEAYIFRIESRDGEDQLVTVEDEEEFERVAAALTELDEGWEDQDESADED